MLWTWGDGASGALGLRRPPAGRPQPRKQPLPVAVEADEIGAMRPRMRKSATPGKKGAKEPAAWPDEDEHADENFEHTDEFKTADEDVDMEVDEKVTKTEIKSLAKECDEIGALKPRRIN